MPTVFVQGLLKNRESGFLLAGDYGTNAEKCNLQLEAKAHIQVQKWIGSGAAVSHRVC